MTTDTDKLVETALNDAYEKGWCAAAQWANRDDLRHDTGSIAYEGQRDAILSGNAAGLVASLCADVEQDGFRLVSVNAGFTELMEALDRADRKGYMPDAIYSAYEGFQYRDPASTVASLTAQRDAALARVAELEKDAARYRWLRSVPNAFKAQRIVNDTPHGMDATIDAAMNGGNQ